MMSFGPVCLYACELSPTPMVVVRGAGKFDVTIILFKGR